MVSLTLCQATLRAPSRLRSAAFGFSSASSASWVSLLSTPLGGPGNLHYDERSAGCLICGNAPLPGLLPGSGKSLVNRGDRFRHPDLDEDERGAAIAAPLAEPPMTTILVRTLCIALHLAFPRCRPMTCGNVPSASVVLKGVAII